jgi:hypothetical protein
MGLVSRLAVSLAKKDALRAAEEAALKRAVVKRLAVSKAPAIIKARSGTAKANAADVLVEAASKGKKHTYAD